MIKVETKGAYYIEENSLKATYNDYVDETNAWNEGRPDNPDEILPFEKWVEAYVEEENLYWLASFGGQMIEKFTFNEEP